MKNILAILFTLISTFSVAQLTNGLIGMFPFDQNYNDLGPSSIVLDPIGTSFTSDRSGVQGNGLALGNQQYIDINNSALKIDLPITISVWVNVQSFTSFNMIFISDNVYNDYYGYWLNIAANTGQVGAHIAGGLGGANSSNRRSFLTANSLSLNTWHHVVAIIKGAFDMQIYIDCELQNGTYQGTGAIDMLYSNAGSRVGGYIGNSVNSNGAFFNGKMDQVALWNRALTYDEVRLLCDNDNSLALDEVQTNNGLDVYPNPFTNMLYVKLKAPLELSYQIMDLQGRIYLEGQVVNETQIDLSLEQLPAGTYLFKTTSEKGTAIQKIRKL